MNDKKYPFNFIYPSLEMPNGNASDQSNEPLISLLTLLFFSRILYLQKKHIFHIKFRQPYVRLCRSTTCDTFLKQSLVVFVTTDVLRFNPPRLHIIHPRHCVCNGGPSWTIPTTTINTLWLTWTFFFSFRRSNSELAIVVCCRKQNVYTYKNLLVCLCSRYM